jgi:hypothetical protein
MAVSEDYVLCRENEKIVGRTRYTIRIFCNKSAKETAETKLLRLMTGAVSREKHSEHSDNYAA